MKTPSSSGSGSGTSSASPPSPHDDHRKRKRMQSNRESARRSRIRKQKHLDDLTAEVAQLVRENNQIMNRLNVTTQQCVKVEAENSVLRAQMVELSQRLQSLNEILNHGGAAAAAGSCMFEADDCLFNSSWPIMAAAEMMLDYYY